MPCSQTTVRGAAALAVWFAATTFSAAAATAASPAAMLGGGNFQAGPIAEARQRFEILNQLGAGWCRLCVQPSHYWPRDERPQPERYDEVVLLAHRHGIRPMILFEYYSRPHGPLGGAEKWRTIGRAFAGRFAPGSDWLREQGIDNWGIEFYSAMNEPMWREHNTPPIPVNEYVAALEGLAAGVHAVDRRLKVSPGGFQEIPLLRQNPYGPAIAHLYNRGTLYAIDIHRYFDVQWQPMHGSYRNSLQNQFDEVKKAWGITADIRFYTTEFNFKRREVTEEEAARGLLTALWDALGVVGEQGQGVTEFAMPWNIFHLAERDPHYGMAAALDPWKPTRRGEVLRLVGSLTRDMEFIHRDPRGRGVYVLEGGGRKLWVWQNLRGWTNQYGESFTLTDLPRNTGRIEIYGWDGLRRTIERTGEAPLTVTDLPQEETLMLLAAP